jgi:hypothetical protein
LGKVY